MDLILLTICLIGFYLIGNSIEKKHYKEIKRRELALYKHKYLSFGSKLATNKKVEKVTLVSSSVVLGCDRFKTFIANLRNIFGGNVSSYESVMDRARREALLRIREQALRSGAHIVLNVKLETVMVDPVYYNSNNPKVAVTAYGTAIRYGTTT